MEKKTGIVVAPLVKEREKPKEKKTLRRDDELWKGFEKEVEQLTGRTTPMGVKEILLERRKREGIREGIIEGIEQGEANKNYEFVERLIEKLGFSDEQIMDVANVSIDFVKKVRGELASRKIEA